MSRPRRCSPVATSICCARLGDRPPLVDVLRAIAALGGHLRQNGDPGWQVLGRGMQRLRLMETGWLAAQQSGRCDQS
jgi:hypothetical protein